MGCVIDSGQSQTVTQGKFKAGRGKSESSQEFILYGIEKAHVLRALNWKFALGVVSDHGGNGRKGLTEITKNPLPVVIQLNLHVHKPLGTSETTEKSISVRTPQGHST